MNKKIKTLTFILFSLGIFGLIIQAGLANTALEYKVSIGDYSEYELTKLKGEGEGFGAFTEFITEEGPNITVKQGDIMKVEVTKVNTSGVFGKITYKENVSAAVSLAVFIQQTTANTTYWEDKVGTTDVFGLVTNMTLDGDLFVNSTSTYIDFFGITMNTTIELKMNIKTGWIEYYYTNIEMIGVTAEMELRRIEPPETKESTETTGTSGLTTPGFEIILLVIGIGTITLFRKKRK
ncbi:MAG: Loki-CTERM sorting domain-containing protein [Candidatus Hodarchaeales archaeon]|jgi:hypothetical protein